MKTKHERDEARRRSASFAKFHAEKSQHGGFSQDFHVLARTFLEADVPALLDAYEELERERDVLRRALGVAADGSVHAIDMWIDKARAEMEAEAK